MSPIQLSVASGIRRNIAFSLIFEDVPINTIPAIQIHVLTHIRRYRTALPRRRDRLQKWYPTYMVSQTVTDSTHSLYIVHSDYEPWDTIRTRWSRRGSTVQLGPFQSFAETRERRTRSAWSQWRCKLLYAVSSRRWFISSISVARFVRVLIQRTNETA